jgi:hypothetical protein
MMNVGDSNGSEMVTPTRIGSHQRFVCGITLILSLGVVVVLISRHSNWSKNFEGSLRWAHRGRHGAHVSCHHSRERGNHSASRTILISQHSNWSKNFEGSLRWAHRGRAHASCNYSMSAATMTPMQLHTPCCWDAYFG